MSENGSAAERHESHRELLAQYALAVRRLREQAKDPFSDRWEFDAALALFLELTDRIVGLREQVAGDNPSA